MQKHDIEDNPTDRKQSVGPTISGSAQGGRDRHAKSQQCDTQRRTQREEGRHTDAKASPGHQTQEQQNRNGRNRGGKPRVA